MPGKRKKKAQEPHVSESNSAEICFALELLKSLHLGSMSEDLLKSNVRSSTRVIYTNMVTLWLMILQRLHGGKTLEEVVSHLLSHERSLLPDNKRVREDRVSENSGAYSQARKRLELDWILKISEMICNRLSEMSPVILDGRRVFILDGTTITLPPTKLLREAFPPAPNQHGESVWPVAMLMVANELQSGCAMLPQIDPMYGELRTSEAEQAGEILTKLPANSIVLADSGFGIYRVAHCSLKAGHEFLFRLTHSRFKALRRSAEPVEEGAGYQTFYLRWKPSDKDRQSSPDLPEDASLEVLLHQVEIPGEKSIYLVSNLEVDANTAAELYRRRYDVEFDIRDVKVTMDTENIRAKSVDMAKKELYTSVVAYNLVAQFRRLAARVAKVHPRKLRFKGIWTTFKDRLLFQTPSSLEEWMRRFDDALLRAAKKKHPNRKKTRSYPRKAHTRRQKSTKSEKELRKKKKTDTDLKPP